jgi:hypothetical protein
MVGRSADLGSRRPWSTVAGVVMVQTRVERSVGRPLLLDRALIRTISASVRKGAFLHVAAEAAGVRRRALPVEQPTTFDLASTRRPRERWG